MNALAVSTWEETMGADINERIRAKAHEIWENEGRPEGHHQRLWDQAADEITGDDEHETLQDLIDEDDREDARADSEPVQPASVQISGRGKRGYPDCSVEWELA
jgi:hypothetical protein